ncbi:hypothetical protein GCM10018963_55020 [Saccharothrix longispora]
MRIRLLGIRVIAVLIALWSTTALAGVAVADAPQDGNQLFNPNSGLCLSVSNGSVDPGSRTEIWNCLGSPSQLWELNSKGQLLNPNSALCLNTVGYGTKLSTRTEIWVCNDKVALWKFDGVNLVHAQSGLCLNVVGSDIKPGAPTELWYCPDTPSTKWQWWKQ